MIKTSIIIAIILIISGWVFLLFNQPDFIKKNNLDLDKFRGLSLLEQVEYLDQASKKNNILELREFIKTAYPEEPNDKHELSHKLGELAIEKEGIEGFGYCDSLLQFGCFHSAALTAVKLRGDDPDLARELWNGCKSKEKLPGSCLHGLGHAILVIKHYNLLAAYEECGHILDKEEEAFWCEDGVSMENINRSMAPSSLGEYSKEDDIFYPCNSIPKQYEASCVRNHVGYLYRFWAGDFSKALAYCSSFNDTKTIEECVNVIGSLMVTEYSSDQEKLINECHIAGPYYQFCIEGAVVAYSMARQFDRAEKLCDTLTKTEVGPCLGRIDFFSSSN